jgi:RNA recognition motif-containing protein
MSNINKFTLFLSRLPSTATNEKVESVLSPYGTVDKVKLKMIKNGNACAGYGFVELLDEQVMKKILANAFRLKFQGEPIKVQVNERGVTLKAYKAELDLRKVYVIGIPQSAKDKDLKSALEAAGPIERAYTIKEGKTQESKHYGYAIFQEVSGAEQALKIKKFRLGKYKLTCKTFASKKKKIKVKKTKINNLASQLAMPP